MDLLASSFIVHGLITAIFFWGYWPLFIVLFIRGAWPDIAGIIGGTYRSNFLYKLLFKNGKKPNWRMYQTFHMTNPAVNYNTLWWKIYRVVFFDHLLIDKWTHKKEGGWTSWAYYLEGFLWMPIIIYFLIKVGVLK